MIIVRHCKEADKEHNYSCRQYAHTYHYNNIICVAKEWFNLPLKNQMGLIAHEVGHLLVNKKHHKEQEADRQANKFFGIKVRYKTFRYGRRLQYLNNRDLILVYRWSLDNIRFK